MSEETEESDVSSDNSTQEQSETEPEEVPQEEEPPTETEEDPFPEDTPVAVQREASTFINRLSEVGVEVTQVSHQHRPPEDADEEDDFDEHEGELDSIGLQCNFEGGPSFFIILPIDEPYNLFQAEYDLVEEMVFSSPHEHLGGEFEAMAPPQQWESYQNVRDGFEMEQVLGLAQSNRGIPLPTLEAWFTLLKTSSEKFIVEVTRLQYEFIGGIVQRRLFTSPTELGTQELYETVTQLLALRRGIQNLLVGAYILNGIQVPENFEELPHVDEEPDLTEPAHSKGFQ